MAVLATAVWRVRPSGSNTNGGGYDSGISGAATDYSQQNAAQATGTNGVTVGTAVFVDATANAFTSAMVGNAVYITGAGQTTGWYFVTVFTSASTVTLDRSPGTGTGATWNLGGGWADPGTNMTSSGPLVGGNQVFILGSGTPNPAAYTYDYTFAASFVPAAGDSTNGYITYANDPATPGYKVPPDTTGGMPTIRCTESWMNGQGASVYVQVEGLWFVAQTPGTNNGIFRDVGIATAVGCVHDQFSFPTGFFQSGGTNEIHVMGCEVFSSVAGSGNSAVFFIDTRASIINCNIHDTTGGGIQGFGFMIDGCIFSNCAGDAITCSSSGLFFSIKNCTIDGNTGHGIVFGDTLALVRSNCENNIISNHVTGGKFGMTVGAGTAAVNDRAKGFIDYNTFYNNTTNYNAISAGPHDTALGTTPYVGSSTEDYTLA